MWVITNKHIVEQQSIGDQLYDQYTAQGYDVAIRYDKQAYDLSNGTRVTNPKGNTVYADVQAFDKATGRPLSSPYEIERASNPNWGVKNTNYGPTTYIQVLYNDQ